MAVIFGSVPVMEVGDSNFTSIDIACGLRIVSGSVDRTNLKRGRHTVGQAYSMPWSYPDSDLSDLGGPTSIVIQIIPLLPSTSAAPIMLSTTFVASTTDGIAAIEQIENELHNMLAGSTIAIDTGSLSSHRVRIISLLGDEAFGSDPIVAELMVNGLTPGGFPPLPTTSSLATGLAVLDYTDTPPRARTILFARPQFPENSAAWIRLKGISKTGDFTSIGLGPDLFPATSLPAINLSPWHVNTTTPIGGETSPLASTMALSRFNQLLTAADLTLDERDIPTGWILVHGLTFRFRNGFLLLEADLANTTPLAPNFKLGSFGALRAEITLDIVENKNQAFDDGVFGEQIEVDIDMNWDDNPSNDLEDFHPVDPWFESIVSDFIRDRLVETVSEQINAQVQPRILEIATEEIENRRPPNLFSDNSWIDFRNQIVAKFFVRFTSMEFFGQRQINGVNVIGGLEINAIAGSFADALVFMDINNECPGIEAANALGSFGSFFSLANFRSVVRSDHRCSGWDQHYLKNRKELVSVIRKNPTIAKNIMQAAWAVSPMLSSSKNRLDKTAVAKVDKLLLEMKKLSSDTLKQDFDVFQELVKKSAGSNLEEFIISGAEFIKPTAKDEPIVSLSDSPNRINTKLGENSKRKKRDVKS